jgi:hypothetical protein
MTKIYKVEFMHYTDAFKNGVKNENKDKYLEVGEEPFLISENDIEEYMEYGDGFRTLEFVGYAE